jgi:two-component system CheB/CheR fusion protein
MSRLLDDLLDVSRITRGVVELRKRVVDVRELITQAIDTVASMAHSRGHDLVVSFAPGAAHVLVDPTRMEQAVVNLLTNAIRYTPRGGNLTITVTADGTNVLIRVVDNGRGIAPELLPYVFDMFTQGSRPLDRSEGGLGVGLTVARRLVDMHGGDIEARSDGLGCGSTFTITLPQVAVAPGTDSTPPRGKRAVRARRILIVEDQPDAAEMLALFLEGQSHAVRVVEDGHAALVETAAYKPDIILIDIGLPGMSGYDLAERLRSDRTQPQPLLVAITGYGQDEDRARSLAVGFDHHLVKPIDPDILTELMAEPASPEFSS